MSESIGETLLERTNREFNDAVIKHDYTAALEAVRWVYDSRFDPEHLDKANAESLSRAILEKALSPKSIPEILRTIVFSAETAPPALLLYVADLLAGEKLGRPKKSPTRVALDDSALLIKIGELAERAGSEDGAYKLAAEEGIANGNPESVKRAYMRAKANRTSGF